MSEQEKTLVKEIQSALIKGAVTVILSSLLFLISFYFVTNYKIESLQKDMERKLDKEPMQTEIKHIRKTLEDIEKKL